MQGEEERVGIMSLAGLQLFHQIEQKMDWLVARQSVLAENVANADTPGYLSKDLKPYSFQRELQNASAVEMTTTSDNHMQVNGNASAVPVVETQEGAWETTFDGNQVSLEDQMTKIADTGMEYQAMTNLYSKQLSMLKTALGRNGTNA